MNTKDREELAKMSERTLNIWKVVEKLEKHQETQNGIILELVKSVARFTVWRKVIVSTGGMIILAIGSLWTKFQGLW